MLTLREEQLNMVAGGAVALPIDATVGDFVIRDDIVIWNGHEDMGKGVCIVNFFGKCIVQFDIKSFPWIKDKIIDEDELTVVGHMPPRPL